MGHGGGTRRRFMAGAGAAAGAFGSGAWAAEPDVLVRGGPIYTGEGLGTVQALRLRAGRVVAAGSEADARGGGAPGRVIDLQGAAAFPGFIDGHTHLPHLGLISLQLGLSKATSLDALKARLRAYAGAHPQGPIVGHGWIENLWPERRFPTRDDLDAVVADRPVYLVRADGHLAVANSAMLALVQVGPGAADPEGGRIERDAGGRPTGVLVDRAMRLAEAKLPAPTEAQHREALRLATRLYAQAGWAGAANMSTTLADARRFDALGRAGELPLRLDLFVSDEDADGLFAAGPRSGGGVTWRGVKMYMDGALGSRGAALLAPYSDAPNTSGLVVTPPDHMREVMRRARRAGLQVATHAIGDRGNRLTLDLYRAVFADDPAALRRARWRIEHAQVIAPADIPRFAQLGVIASMQASHAITDLYFAPTRLGPERLAGAYAWRQLLDSGAVLCGGTDAPVGEHDPQGEIYASIWRHAYDGSIGADWRPQEVMTRAQALASLTTSAAYALFQDRERGLLAPGRRADLSVFSADLMRAEPLEALKAKALLTISDGRITHDALTGRRA